MQLKKQILIYTAVTVLLSMLECALSPLFSFLEEGTLWGAYPVYCISRALALLAPFFMLGVAIDAARVRSLSFSLIFVGITALVDLFAQLPLSLMSYDATLTSAPYSLTLLSYMLSSALSSLLFLLFLLLGYAIFLQGKPRPSGKCTLFSLKDGGARAIALAAVLLTLYNIVLEVLDILEYAKEKLYILSGEDIFDFVFFLSFLLLLGVFAFFIGRMSERLLPTAPYKESIDE